MKPTGVRLDPEIKAWLKRRAKLRGTSINREINFLLGESWQSDPLGIVKIEHDHRNGLYRVGSLNSPEVFRVFIAKELATTRAENAGFHSNQIKYTTTQEIAE